MDCPRTLVNIKFHGPTTPGVLASTARNVAVWGSAMFQAFHATRKDAFGTAVAQFGGPAVVCPPRAGRATAHPFRGPRPSVFKGAQIRRWRLPSIVDGFPR